MAAASVAPSRKSTPIQRLQGMIADVLDDRIDDAVRDGQKTFYPRLVATALMAGIAAFNIGIGYALVWITLAFSGELLISSMRARYFRGHEPATTIMRAWYLATAFAVVIVWTSMPLSFWFADAPGVSAAAIVILATMIIHAEAFTFRSVPVLLVTGLPPAVALVMLPWIDAAFTGVQAATFAVVALLGVGYACVSVRSHRATAGSLRATQDELERFAYFDALTSLANRRQFTDHLRRLIALSERRGTRFALLLLDLDQFKQVNDTLGHDAGDALLIAIGARLRNAVRREDDVARLGGDEFAILLPDADDAAAIAAVCERIASSCGETIEFNGVPMQSSLSVGVAIFPDNGDRQDTLYKSADVALYLAKQSGRNTWRYSDATLAKIAARVPADPGDPEPVAATPGP